MFNDRLMVLTSGVVWPHIAMLNFTCKIEKALDLSAHLEAVVATQRLSGNYRANARETPRQSRRARLAGASVG
jgi:hypothetical protein